MIIADGRRVWLCEAKFAGALSRKQIDSKKARYDALVELSALTELRIEFVEVDALPAGRHDRRSSTDMVKELNVELNIHAGVEFARVTRTKMNGTECSDFEIVPVKI
ncbi:hypothetical protein IHQ68_17850 [Chelatococcus sambhunathii]|uniref:Uncharacterized protein n=1 Tax=Chelatococcus sambhunathii TaxID=363953 RepID=A0ABU1DK38_9HYPH|nr:hypothetical protein [Chelatococcus sambhunathii]MDR4308487.1 hypothetical protein [Chelatococcus sambhunathii]